MGLLERMGIGFGGNRNEKISEDPDLVTKLKEGKLSHEDLERLAGENEALLEKIGQLEIPKPDEADKMAAWLKAFEDDELSLEEVERLATEYNEPLRQELDANRKAQLNAAVAEADKVLAGIEEENAARDAEIKKIMEE